MPEPKSPVLVGLQPFERQYAEHQVEYNTLPALRSSENKVREEGYYRVMSRWELTKEERDDIAHGADIYITLISESGTIIPHTVEVFSNDECNVEAIRDRLGLPDEYPTQPPRTLNAAAWRGESGFVENIHVVPQICTLEAGHEGPCNGFPNSCCPEYGRQRTS
jgi:hypothetical protein